MQTSLSGLSPGTTYHYRWRCVAIESPYVPALHVSKDQTFTTNAVELTTELASGVTTNSATLHALLDTPFPGQLFFQFGPTAEYGSTTAEQTFPGASAAAPFDAQITGLIAGLTYHFRAVAVVNGVSWYGNDRLVTPFGPTPSARTLTAADVTTGTARLRGAALIPSGVGTVYFEYGKSASFGKTTFRETFAASTDEQSFDEVVTALAERTEYFFRTVMTIGDIVYRGETMQFVTPADVQVVTQPASDVTADRATLHAAVDTPAPGYLFFQFGPTVQYGGGTAQQVFAGASAPQLFQAPITGLTPGTTYHFRAIAVIDGVPQYGADETFTTAESLNPSVLTLVAADITAGSARLRGTVSLPSGAAAVQFEYGSTVALGSATPAQALAVSVGEQPFDAALSGLARRSKYYFRAVMTIGSTVYRGEVLEFETLPGNTAPVARADFAAIRAGETVLIDVLANDSDPDGDPLTIDSFTQDGIGLVSREGDRLRYTASKSSAAGMQTTFSYTISDPSGETSTATVRLADQFPALKGTYRSRFVDESGAPAGQLQLKLSPDGAFAGTMNVNGSRRTLRGLLPLEGRVVRHLTQAGEPLDLTLALETAAPADEPGRLSGEVARDGKVFTLLPTCKVANSATPGSRGNHTLLLAPPVLSEGPRGMGWATLNVNDSGFVQVKGMLGDGTHFGGADQQRVGGEIVLFSRLYRRSAGWLIGTLTFRSLAQSDVTGSLRWHKPPQANDSFYPGGFDLHLEGTGSIYNPPGRGTRMLTYSNPMESEARLSFAAPALEAPWSVQLRVGMSDVISILDNPRAVKLKLDRASGQFSGSFADPTGVRIPFNGVVVQKLNEGAGVFTLADGKRGGRVGPAIKQVAALGELGGTAHQSPGPCCRVPRIRSCFLKQTYP